MAKVINGVNIERTAAAFKAWDTRRANAQAEIRRNAALKAWETMRARKMLQTIAALKAWDTRKAA